MKSEAIRCAVKLYAEPELLTRFNDPFHKLPRGITELLRIVASDTALKKVSSINHLHPYRFKKILLHYILTVLLQENNSDYRKLGLSYNADQAQCKLHYKLLMNIFHPDKINNEAMSHYHTQLISRAYKNIKNNPLPPAVLTQFSTPSLSFKRNNSFQLSEAAEQYFKLENRKLILRKYLTYPLTIIGFSLIIIFTTTFFLLSLSSPQLVIKKQLSADTSFINKNSEITDKVDKISPELLSSIE